MLILLHVTCTEQERKSKRSCVREERVYLELGWTFLNKYLVCASLWLALGLFWCWCWFGGFNYSLKAFNRGVRHTKHILLVSCLSFTRHPPSIKELVATTLIPSPFIKRDRTRNIFLSNKISYIGLKLKATSSPKSLNKAIMCSKSLSRKLK